MFRLVSLFCLLAFLIACDEGATIKKFGPDMNTADQDLIAGGDEDELTGDEPLSDDGQFINDDGPFVNDDGQIVYDDGEIVPDDNEWTDDGTVWPDDHEWTDDGTIWPDDNEWTDDGTVWPDDGPIPHDDGVIGPDQDWTDDVKPDSDAVPTYCGANFDCGDTEYCAKDTCDPMAVGQCATKPEMCPPLYSPVCGCDGTTYGSECDAQAAGENVDYAGECGGEEKFSTLYYYYDQATMSAPEAKIVIINGEDTVEFIGADLMTRSTSGFTTIYLDTKFYGLTDDGSQIEFHLKVSSIGWSIPKTVTLDGGDNYARWTRLGPEMVGELYGEVTIQHYDREDTVITLIEINGDALTFTPVPVP